MVRILVVDNNPDVRAFLDDLLAQAGHVVKSVANERDALTSIAEEVFDFAVVDVRLHEEVEEDETGITLAMALLSLRPNVRVVLLTQYVRARQLVRMLRYQGVVDFVDKSQDVATDLLRAIEQATMENERQRHRIAVGQDWLAIALVDHQPLTARSYGSYPCSVRSAHNLVFDTQVYTRLAENARRLPSELRFMVKDIGERLWRTLFEDHPEILRTYTNALARSRVLPLRFECPSDSLALPVEFVYTRDPSDYLVLQHPVSRFLLEVTPRRLAISPSDLALTRTLRLLIIASNTEPPIDGVDTEARQLVAYFRNQKLIPVKVTHIPTEKATLTRVRKELASEEYDIIHYAGHGSFNSASPEESALYFWTEENRSGMVYAMRSPELEYLLEQSEARLVYLSCCHGMHTGPASALLDDDFLGLAHAVAHAGVPSVLGYRWPVSDAGAPKLAKTFYEALLELGSPDYALWQARRELAAADRNDPTWMSPILIHQV
jgi:CheY-like chemotaxis protein